MPVARISKQNLRKILTDNDVQDASCVVKFYSNNCHYCVSLHDPYVELSKEFEDVHFFAFNVSDHPQVEKIFGFTGVPTVCMVKTGGPTPERHVMKEPKKPNKETWYPIKEIRAFIASGK